MTKESVYNLSKTLQTSKFSIRIDESTDVSAKNYLVLLARFYYKVTNKIYDRFAALLQVRNAFAATFFKIIF